MFSVVGLIGMTGIIINDSIVLVTTIDEYAEERGLIPAIIDGAADRLRAGDADHADHGAGPGAAALRESRSRRSS